MVTVARVGSVRLGRQRSPDKQTGQYPTKYLRAGNIARRGLDLSDILEMDFTPAERETFGLRSGDIVLAEASGSAAQVGRAALWRDEIPGCCYQNTVIRFRPHAVLSEYAFVVFRHYAMKGVFAQVARGVGIQHLGASQFAVLPFALPPLAEQRRIADSVERRVAELREAEASLRASVDRINEQNQEILAAAVAGELVESEAVIAERERRSFQDARSLLAEVEQRDEVQASLFGTDRLSWESEGPRPPVPSTWAWVRIGDLGTVTLGRQRAPRYHQGPHMRPYLRVANVYEDRIDTSGILEMNFNPNEYDVYQLRWGDILLNEGQSPELVGRPAMYRDEVPGACFQNTLIRFRAGPAVEPEFALIVFRHYLHTGEFRKVARWSTNLAHLGRERFIVMPFPLPPLAEQRRIAIETKRRLDASAAQKMTVEAALGRIPEMERELLAAAVAGELVPQDEADESAPALLERLGLPPAPVAPSLEQRAAYEEGDMKKSRRSPAPAIDLGQVLREAGRPLRLPELFSMAGYDRDSVGDVELFYLALRADLGRSIRQVGDSLENATLEPIPDAP